MASSLAEASPNPCSQEQVDPVDATLAEIALDIDDWAQIGPATGSLTRFVRPRDLDPELGPDHQ